MVLSFRRDRAARGVISVAAAAVFLCCWELLHHWFYAHHQIIDTPTYERYGRAIQNGLLPYGDIAIEYPPGALPVFVAPTFVGSYAGTFGWLMAACGVGCLAFAATVRASPRVLAFIAVSPLLIGSLALSRFDFWPTLFVTAAVAAFVRDRHRIGFAALGAAVAAKFFGVVLIPLAIVWTVRRRGIAELARAGACGLAVVAATVLPFAVLAPGGVWHSFLSQASRPLQIESTAASFLTTLGHPKVILTHGSFNLAGHGTVAAATTALEIAALIGLWIAFARGPAEDDRLLRYAAACVCAFIVLGKLLSPQFLIWLVPLVPLVRGRRGAAASLLLAGAFMMTQVFFPSRYSEYVFHLHLAGVVLARNLVLIGLLVLLIWPEHEPQRSS